MTRRGSLGVGFIGAGPVTQAIHLPTLATMPHRFHVECVMDTNREIAERVAARCNARASIDETELLGDPAVEVVAICSPNAFHARQTIASCRAGKKLVLCEKPLATTRADAEAIGRASRQSGTPVVVGTMHSYDPAMRRALDAWQETGETARSVRSSIFLPGNDDFVRQATDLLAAPAPSPEIAVTETPETMSRRLLGNAVLGLAIHDIPLVRALYGGGGGTLRSMRVVPPFGYDLTLATASADARLLAFMPGRWPPDWQLQATGARHALAVVFTPSYVLAGSASARLESPGGARVFEHAVNGYEAMWSHMADLAAGISAPIVDLETAIADLGFAIDLVDMIDHWAETC